MAVITFRLDRLRSLMILDAPGRLCESVHPEYGSTCEGSGTHLGPHNYGSRVGDHGVSWPNERVRQLYQFGWAIRPVPPNRP